MKNDQGMLICESILLEFDPLTMAAGGAALGAGVNAANWARQRLGLRREMQGCRGNPECVTNVRSKIAMVNKNAIKSTIDIIIHIIGLIYCLASLQVQLRK
jgi:hypothetical protein